MFMLKSTHRSIVEAMQRHTAKRIDDYRRTIEGMRATGHVLEDNLIEARAKNHMLHGTNEALGTENIKLREQLAERQVPAVRGSRGRFVRRIDSDHMPVEERRDFNAAEQAMIEAGDMPGAKSAWHARTGR